MTILLQNNKSYISGIPDNFLAIVPYACSPDSDEEGVLQRKLKAGERKMLFGCR